MYGWYFRFKGNEFVSLPKRLSTLTKKGYRLEVVERTYKCVFREMANGHVHNLSVEVVEEQVTPVQEEKFEVSVYILPYLDYEYSTYFKQ